MSVPFTLSRYFARSYFLNLLFLLMVLLGIVYLFDTVELIRRASAVQDVPLSLIFKMGLLKLPEVGQVLFPFAVLFAAMFTFWQLNRRSELIVLRSSGFSVWQFIAPIVIVAFFVGLVQVSVINPIGALLVSKYEDLEREHLDNQDNDIAIFKEGLWLRQSVERQALMPNRETILPDGYLILHAEKIQSPDWILRNLNVFVFENDDSFVTRLDAQSARLVHDGAGGAGGQWVFENVHVHQQSGDVVAGAEMQKTLILPTALTIQDIEESFSSPESVSFWSLRSHIKTLEETGFDASRLRVHYHALLAQPLFFIAMVLLAATVSIRPPRLGGGFHLFIMGIFVGFVVFFMSSYMQALGASQQIPVVLAAWAPASICFLLGLSVIMSFEDG